MLRKLFTLSFIFLVFETVSFSFTDELSNIEYNKYGTTFEYESLAQRLNRLETDYFGMSQSGDINSRIMNLSKINTNKTNSAILSKNYGNDDKPKSKLRNFWDNITSGNGYITGFTPSMNTFTTQGYANDIYNNEFYNLMNQPSFCPYDMGYHNRSAVSRPHNYYTKRVNGVNRFTPNHNPYRNYPYSYNGYNPYNRPYVNRTTYNMPPNFETKSSIHILRD